MNVADDCQLPFLWVGVNHSNMRSFVSVSNCMCIHGHWTEQTGGFLLYSF
jgi:hypothetical protein